MRQPVADGPIAETEGSDDDEEEEEEGGPLLTPVKKQASLTTHGKEAKSEQQDQSLMPSPRRLKRRLARAT